MQNHALLSRAVRPKSRRPASAHTSGNPAYVLLVASMVLTLGLFGCERSGKRVEIAQTPNPLTSQRHQPVKGDLLASSRKALVRAAQLTVSDAVATLGGFVYHADATYTYQKAERTLQLKEKLILEQRADGAFRARLTNNRDKGFEVRWIGDALYQKERFRPFRVISHELAIAHRWQRRSYGRWRAMVGLFGARLALSNAGNAQLLQRECVQYNIALGSPQEIKLPSQGTAWDGEVPENTRGAAAKQPRTLLNAKGRVWIDQKSGLPLKIDFTGSYQIASGKQKTLATIKLQASFVSLGDPSVKAPAKVVAFKREPEPKDPFAGNHKPGFVQDPPNTRTKARKPPRKKRRRKR